MQAIESNQKSTSFDTWLRTRWSEVRVLPGAFNRIVDVDVDSFEVLGVNYAKDQNSVWVAITKKHNAAELRQLSESARNRAGAGGWLLVVVRLENVDASTFQVSRVKQYFAIDDPVIKSLTNTLQTGVEQMRTCGGRGPHSIGLWSIR